MEKVMQPVLNAELMSVREFANLSQSTTVYAAAYADRFATSMR